MQELLSIQASLTWYNLFLNREEARKVEVPPEPRVDFGFSNPVAPAPKKEPDPDEPQWIDLPPLPDEEPKPGSILPSPKARPDLDEVEVRVHEAGGEQIRVPDLNGMEHIPSQKPAEAVHDTSDIPFVPDMPAVVPDDIPAIAKPASSQAPIPAVSQVENNREFIGRVVLHLKYLFRLLLEKEMASIPRLLRTFFPMRSLRRQGLSLTDRMLKA